MIQTSAMSEAVRCWCSQSLQLLLAIQGRRRAPPPEAEGRLVAQGKCWNVYARVSVCVCVLILFTISFSSQSMPESQGFMESGALQGLWLP